MLLIISLSCTNTKPEITYGFLQLVQYQGETGVQEHFSFFIMPNDDEGIDNLDILYLFHDRDQLRWQIKSGEWIKYTDDGKTWIGTRSITVSQGNLPRGVFRAVLINKNGESSERSFTFDGNVRFPFPELRISGNSYTVNSRWPVNRLICYDSSGNYINYILIEINSGDLSLLNLPANTSTVALWAEDENNFCSAYTNAVPVR